MVTVEYLEGPYLRRVTGTVAAVVGEGTPTSMVVSTDGGAHVIPIRLVIKVIPA